MTIAKDKVVSVIYELKTDKNGEVVEQTTKENPLTFLYGAGQMIPKFEENLAGLKVGDTFDFVLPTADAYGEATEQAVIDLPKNIFEVEGKFDEDMIKVGNVVPMQDSNGNRMNGIVLEVAEETIKMDFNHPLAGDDLHFKGEVIDVRDATPEELNPASCGDGCCDSGTNDGCGSGGCGCGC